MPQVSRDRKTGGYKVKATGWEQFGDFLTGLSAGMEKANENKQKAEALAQQTRQEQMQLKIQLQELMEKDPETYDKLVEDPAIKDYLDPKRVEDARKKGESPINQLIDKVKNRGKDKGYVAPDIPKASAEQHERARLRREAEEALRKATVAEAGTKVVEAGVNKTLAEQRAEDLKSPDPWKRWSAKWNRAPSVQDMQAEYMEGKTDLLEMGIPGTKGWRREQARQWVAQEQGNYKLAKEEDITLLQEWGEYHAGLRDKPPGKLPDSYKAAELRMQERGMKLREQEYGLNAAQLIEGRSARAIEFARTVAENGGNFNEAVGAYSTFMKTGQLPAGFSIPKDKQKELNIKLDELKIKSLEAEMKLGSLLDPEIDSAMKLLQNIPIADRPTSKEYRHLQELFRKKHGYETPKDDPTFWQALMRINPAMGVIRGAVNTAATLYPPVSAAMDFARQNVPGGTAMFGTGTPPARPQQMISGQLGTSPEKSARLITALQGVLAAKDADPASKQRALQTLIAEIAAGRF